MDRVYFPGLNGLRAIAALAVVFSHLTIALGNFNLNAHLLGTLPNGNPKGIDLADFGVSIFFSLSGFLITYLLLAENSRGRINIKNFYIRRILRIWPLYYLYFLFASLCIAWWKIPHEHFFNFFYVFFSANVPKVFQTKSELLGHYWSLGVEEQFYLFWPWFVLRFSHRLFSATACLLILLVGAKIIAHFVFPDTYFETAMYVNRFDCMLIGALGAILYFNKNRRFIAIATAPMAQLIAWLCIFLAAVNNFHLAAIVDQEIMCLVTVTLIIGQIASNHPVIMLERRAFDFLGRISYGIYVIHPLIIFGLSKVWIDMPLPPFFQYLLIYTIAVGLTILLSYLSFEYFEKRFLAMKGWFSTVKTVDSLEQSNQEASSHSKPAG